MKIYNSTRSVYLAHTAIMADTFFTRLKGLLGRSFLPPGWCLVLKPCSSVHTVFMAFSIDIIFVDSQNRVLEAVSAMPPYRFSRIISSSRMVIEFPPGSLAPTKTSAGDIIKIC
ncbi:MAG: DUF192 domain-containing protein [Desulfocucumaceae bacterium]